MLAWEFNDIKCLCLMPDKFTDHRMDLQRKKP